MMEPKSAAEELPALYRAVLDRVAELEAPTASATMANRVRADATAIYSRAWDERARRDLRPSSAATRPSCRASRAAARGFRRRTLRAPPDAGLAGRGARTAA